MCMAGGYLPRHVDHRLVDACAAFPIVVLDGPRAVGKTTTAKRIAASGNVLAELDEDAADHAIGELLAERVGAIAVCAVMPLMYWMTMRRKAGAH